MRNQVLMNKVLVVGGAGYIGSHMVWLLGQRGVNVVTLDNLCTGHRDAVLCGELVIGDLEDRALLEQLFSTHRFDAVLHFASFIQVGESVVDPSKYYNNNVSNTLNLLESMRMHGVSNLVFSSTAAVFGEPCYSPVDEEHPRQPINPYGRTKWFVEQILADYDRAYEMRSVSLRYFNAAGAHADAILGERHQPETHLIPLVLQVASGRRENIKLFGDDFDTPDGTCVRDYIHVLDLVEAHWRALQYLEKGGKTTAFNLGNGEGYSVLQIINAAKIVTGREVNVIRSPRREGDPERLVADSRRARELLGWQPQYAELETIVRHAWQWESRLE